MENRRSLIAGNWKMFKTSSDAIDTVKEIVRRLKQVIDIDIMIAPPFISISSVAYIAGQSNIAIGAQNLFWEKEGAYTGEISAPMLLSVGCRYVIIGHSERRQYFGETDETVNKKMRAAINYDLTPILCIGESEKERESKDTFSVLDKQVKKGLKGFSKENLKKLVLAYEPIWAIGTGKTATSNQAQEVHRFLRLLLEKNFGNMLAESTRIIYGGSVKPDNINELMAMDDVDGALVGGASLSAETFCKIVNFKR
ncbi:MAG: triose-phosphate isomerase [Desulfobacterales bacterium]|nr:triose-phosphate isomerase [Desulfobacterales bacterium]